VELNTLKSAIKRNISNLPGWRTNKKIIVIESDDWGSIRMPSVKSLENLEKQGLDLRGGDSNRYNLYDTLASKDDLADLFESLIKFKDQNGRSAAFTAVSVVANPDFEKIKDNNFEIYFPEPFTKTLERYYGSDSPFALWKEGIAGHIFVPQFHAREHLNIGEWMRALRAGNKEALLAFDEGMWGFNNKRIHDSSISFQAAFDLYYPKDLDLQASAISEGLILFEKIFGYKATFFVPPNGPFNNALEKVAAEGGIKYMSASKVQMEPQGYDVNKKLYHWLGQANKHDQLYITRNCFFEPSQGGKDWVSSCLSDIEIAFRWKKPAVISSHRVNFIGSLHPENRKNGLSQLSQLLAAIVKKWPDVIFQTSDELGDSIAASKHHV
jgi:hypothetical protein